MKTNEFLKDIISANWSKDDCLVYLSGHSLDGLLDICIEVAQGEFADCKTVRDMHKAGVNFGYLSGPSYKEGSK